MVRLLFYAILLAVVIYGVFWVIARRNDHGTGGTGGGNGGGGVRPPRGPVGPDDDEDFLRDLEWKRRQQRRDDPTS